jgi:glucosamine--fructose-6-phosphate aminotransferase (isomerizing)
MTELLKDILAEPRELAGLVERLTGPQRPLLVEAARSVAQARRVRVVGIGSSYNAALAVASRLQQQRIDAVAMDASELLHFGTILPGSAAIVLSRSGKSFEIVQLLEHFRKAQAAVIAVTNTPDSPLAAAADVCLHCAARFDHLVSITMYSTLAVSGGLIAAELAGELDAIAAEFQGAYACAEELLPEWRTQIESEWIDPEAPAYFLARGESAASCHETRLLWEEAAKRPATALRTGEFRHGSQEMIRPGARVGMWIDAEKLRDEDLALAADLRNAEARVMLIGQDLPAQAGDIVVNLPRVRRSWQFAVDIIPGQLAAERLSRAGNEDCDTFRLCPYIIAGEGGLTAAHGKR